MLYNLRNRLPDIEDAREVAADRVAKAANTAAQIAREAADRLEDLAWDGLDTVKSRPLTAAALSLGLGILVGGLFAAWQKSRSNGQPAPRAIAVRTGSKPKRRAPKTRRLHPSPDA
jgi:hypothetical protein